MIASWIVKRTARPTFHTFNEDNLDVDAAVLA
jgi:hypothetical protein